MDQILRLPQTFIGWGGIATSLVLGLFVFLNQWRRSNIDESAVILGKWKEMVEQHAEAIAEMKEELRLAREELRAERRENDQLRKSLHEAQQTIARLEADLADERRKRKDEVAGLHRQILQLNDMIKRIDPKSAALILPPNVDDDGNRSMRDILDGADE